MTDDDGTPAAIAPNVAAIGRPRYVTLATVEDERAERGAIDVFPLASLSVKVTVFTYDPRITFRSLSNAVLSSGDVVEPEHASGSGCINAKRIEDTVPPRTSLSAFADVAEMFSRTVADASSVPVPDAPSKLLSANVLLPAGAFSVAVHVRAIDPVLFTHPDDVADTSTNAQLAPFAETPTDRAPVAAIGTFTPIDKRIDAVADPSSARTSGADSACATRVCALCGSVGGTGCAC
ncbi:MAG: hypothetical protein NVSMB64_09610 [Candidatus Velthaea sp.]